MIAKLASQKRSMEVVGHGALRNAGRVAKADIVLTTAGLKGVTLYEPTEIVMSARAGTPIYEIEAILAARGQMLAFEPVDLGPTTGAPGGALIDRRRLCDEFVRLQADHVGQCARQSSWYQGGERPCRTLQVGRARDEERHRASMWRAA